MNQRLLRALARLDPRPLRVVASIVFAGSLAHGLARPAPASALPSGPSGFCESYPDALTCQGTVPTCGFCHVTTYPATWNAFGIDILTRLPNGFEESLPDALAEVATLDSDGDGVDNLSEWLEGTAPGDETSVLRVPMADGAPNPAYNVGGWDGPFAYRRASLSWCGVAPGYDEMERVRGLDAPAQRAEVVALAQACVATPWWRDVGLPELAHYIVRPIEAVGWDSVVGIQLGDYEWDYALFAYAMTGGRDARDLVLADYHVRRAESGELERVEGAVPGRRNEGGQPAPPEQRAGMITTQWFLAINTMFSPLPRTTAAQAYRAFLGYDISLLEGIDPIAGEPLDVDDKGVQQAECAGCHATLDPLAYVFADWEGISLGNFSNNGRFDAERARDVIPGWDDPQAYLFGEPVDSVRDWAEAAAASDAFARNLAVLVFRDALQRMPESLDAEEFLALWQSLPSDGYSIDALIARLVQSDAFGAVR